MRLMRSINLGAGDRVAEALVGYGLLDQVGSLLTGKVEPARSVILTAANVAPLFAERVSASLTKSGFHSILITIAPGETSQSLSVAETICDQMSRAGLDRSSILITLGGGVVGDLGGFVAAIYHRG